MYKIYNANSEEEKYIESVFPSINNLSKPNKKLVCDAYITVLKNTEFEKLEDIKFSKHSTHYRLVDHINEVIEISGKLADYAIEKWNDSFTDKINKEEVLLLALLHDLDKVMLLSEKCEEAGVNKMYSHGYLSALILNELKADEKIVSLVAYHSPKACMHINDPLAMILHYADLFSADHIYMLVDRKPFYFGE